MSLRGGFERMGWAETSRSVRCGKNRGPCSLEPTEFTPHHALCATPTYVQPRSTTLIQRARNRTFFDRKTKKEENGAPCETKIEGNLDPASILYRPECLAFETHSSAWKRSAGLRDVNFDKGKRSKRLITNAPNGNT